MQQPTSMTTLLTSAVLSALLLSGCGGSSSDDDNDNIEPGPSYSGPQTAATVDSDNQQEIAISSREGAQQAITQDSSSGVNLPTGITLSTGSGAELVEQVTLELLASSQLPTGIIQTVQGECGGSADVDSNLTGTSMVFDYNDFCSGSGTDQYTIDGRVEITTTSTQTVMTYRNVTLTQGGETYTLNMTYTCDITGEVYDCAYSSDFEGSDGRTYRTSNVVVTGDNNSGYAISARVYDPEYGYVDIEAAGITVCQDGGIGSGTIMVTDSSGDEVLSVVFTSCDSMTVTFDGVAEIYAQ